MIAHRPSCELVAKDLGNGHFGYYSKNSNLIVINSDVIKSNSFNDYRETLDTLVHEGRHAYQTIIYMKGKCIQEEERYPTGN